MNFVFAIHSFDHKRNIGNGKTLHRGELHVHIHTSDTAQLLRSPSVLGTTPICVLCYYFSSHFRSLCFSHFTATHKLQHLSHPLPHANFRSFSRSSATFLVVILHPLTIEHVLLLLFDSCLFFFVMCHCRLCECDVPNAVAPTKLVVFNAHFCRAPWCLGARMSLYSRSRSCGYILHSYRVTKPRAPTTVDSPPPPAPSPLTTPLALSTGPLCLLIEVILWSWTTTVMFSSQPALKFLPRGWRPSSPSTATWVQTIPIFRGQTQVAATDFSQGCPVVTANSAQLR